jgi:hypothetical protein
MTLVAAMINTAVTGLYVETIAGGMRSHAWTEPQLAALQKQLEQINLPSFVVDSIREERAGVCQLLEKGLLTKVEKNIRREIHLSPSHLVRGWLYQNLVAIARLHQTALDGIDLKKNLFLPNRADSFQHELDVMNGRRIFSPYNVFAEMLVPNFAKGFQTLGHNQTLVNEAQIACALERFRLARGVYPESLEDLSPQFIETFPHDLIGGQPLHYRRTNEEKFLLYSVGWNEKDDGGQSVFKVDGSIAGEKGDWVWKN